MEEQKEWKRSVGSLCGLAVMTSTFLYFLTILNKMDTNMIPHCIHKVIIFLQGGFATSKTVI